MNWLLSHLGMLPDLFGPHWLDVVLVFGSASLCLVIFFALSLSKLYLAQLRRDSEAMRLWSRRLADATFDGLLIHRNGTILAMNRALVRLLGVREREMLGQPCAALGPAEDDGRLRAEFDAPGNGVGEFRLVRADKTELHVEMFSQPTMHDGLPAMVTAIRDVTAARADHAKVERLLHYDSLTNLANRKFFLEKLRDAIVANDAQGGATALFVMDIDHFKQVNEQFSRAGGDLLLRQLAARLSHLLEGDDVAGRISGDKFAIIQHYRGAANRAMALASRLESVLADPFVIEGKMVKTSVSIGLAIYPDHATDGEVLLKAAQFALDLAAQEGGGMCHVFQHAEAHAAQAAAGPGAPAPAPGGTRGAAAPGAAAPGAAAAAAAPAAAQRLKRDLRVAIPNGQITLDYQPVFRASDLSVAGFEALCRWRHPEQGLIPPADFIPLADQLGLIHELGGYVLETACVAAARAAPDWVMAVNLSPVQFRDPQLPLRIANVLKKTGLAPGQLELEVTESLLIDNAAAARAALTAIRALGVGVALDDFGTGFSSLSYLSDFPFSRLKIDQRFVQAVGREPNAEAIICAIMSLAQSLNLQVTAEGVETPAQLAFLQAHGCHLVQGFLLGRPAPQLPLSPPKPAAAKPALFVANA
jgi:diguanylate cyclase (GGDEF)-like protein/PAS domain S-box-containing protein